MKKCFLHIGNFKTGSTSLQSFLFLNKEELKRKNFKVIKEKNFFKNTIHNQKLFKYFDKQNFKKIKDYFPKKKDNSNLILSSEFFSCLSYDPGKILFIKRTILQLGFQPIIIFYFRSDDSYLYSLYAQQLTQRHNIKIDSVFEFKKKIEKFGYYFNKKNKNYYMSQNYYLDNKKIIYNWKKIFKKDFIYIKFDKKSENKIFTDFSDILKLNKQEFQFPNKKNVSRSIKIWNLKRIFYFLYLNFFQKKIFSSNQLDLQNGF